MELLPTIFKSNNEIDLRATKDLINFMIENGIKTGTATILVQGAFGQFFTMSMEERKRHAEACVEAADGRVPIVVGCQAIATDDACELAKFAAKIGADVIQLAPPHYYFSLTENDVFTFFKTVADSAEIGIEVYNNYWSTVGVSPNLLERMADEIDNVIASKWCGEDRYSNYLGYKKCADKLSLIDNAYSFNLTLGHQLGASGFITHVGTFWPEYDIKIWNLMKEGKYAKATEEMRRFFVPLYEFHQKVSGQGASVGLECLKISGRLSGLPRLPETPLTAKEKRELKQLFQNAQAPIHKAC